MHRVLLLGAGKIGRMIARLLVDSGDYDVLVIDRMLPKRDGLSVIGTLREKGNRTPALILSARSIASPTPSITRPRAAGRDFSTSSWPCRGSARPRASRSFASCG